jgi:1-acyl-sn-glycerol-3-phosphate acyltransferase
MIRFIFVAGFVILFLVLSIPLMIIEWIIGKFNMDIKNRSSLAIVKWAFRVCLWFAGTSVTVIGEENVPKNEAVLYVGNHRSFFDILITYVRVPRPTGYVAKDEMRKYHLLSIWMRNLHCLFLDRKDIKKGIETIHTGIEKLQSGISICIFPEGTRNKTEQDFLPFHDGSFKMAQRAKCPIVPMTINNSAAVFENQFPKIRKTHVVLEYGKPIIIDELDKDAKKQIGKYVQGIISETYHRNEKLV